MMLCSVCISQPMPSATCLTHSLQDPQRVLDLHNQARAARGTGALSWSPSLASSAQAYANRCVFQVSWDGSR